MARPIAIFTNMCVGLETLLRKTKSLYDINNDTMLCLMSKFGKILKEMERALQNVRFTDLSKLCAHYFGSPRSKGTSHHVYKTPWMGDPRMNIQRGKDGKAKAYQVRQVLIAVKKMKETKND